MLHTNKSDQQYMTRDDDDDDDNNDDNDNDTYETIEILQSMNN